MQRKDTQRKYDRSELKCVNGTYFHKDSGEYVPLSDREASTEPEKRLQDVSGVVDVESVGFSHWFIYVPSGFDAVETVLDTLNNIYPSGVRLIDRYEHTYSGRGHSEVLKIVVD